MKEKERPRIAMSIDYALRIPDFATMYGALKKEIFVGAFAQTEQMVKEASKNVDQKNYSDEFHRADIDNLAKNNAIKKTKATAGIDNRNYWNELNKTDKKAVEFYRNVISPQTNIGKDFDLSYTKYFYNNEHRMRFVQEYSYNLFGTGQVTNKADIDVLNTAQTKLCDVILFDRVPFARKVPNTFAFLSRSGLYIRSVVFVTSEEEIQDLKKGCIAVWDPKEDASQCIDFPKEVNKPTKKLLQFFMDVERSIKK